MPTDQRQLNGGNQGSGSGLDADQIDGLEPSQLDVDKVDGNDASDLGGGISGETGNERVEYGNIAPDFIDAGDFDTVSISFDTAFNSRPDITHGHEMEHDNAFEFGNLKLIVVHSPRPSNTGFELGFVNDSSDNVEMGAYWSAIGE